MGKAKLTIEEMQAIAAERGGKCLSVVYVNSGAHLLWECKDAHTWKAVPDSIKAGTWCPECRKWQSGLNRRKYDMALLHKIAEEKGGKFLSNEYKGYFEKHLWECSNKHKFKANINTVTSVKSWCPYCSAGTGERICREFFEQLFQTSFLKHRVNWIKSDKGRSLELDGYSKKLCIAFEHQGTQHYFRRKHFKDHGLHSFDTTQKRDKLKLELCWQRGILLIPVPSILEILGVDKVKDFIKEELLKNYYPLPVNFDSIEVNPEAAYIIDSFQKYRDIAHQKGGKLLSTHYISSQSPALWECSEGHKWRTAPNNILNGTWCAICVGNVRRTITDMQKAAKERGGRCLSKKYINNRTHLLWQCKRGHKWRAIPDSVARLKSWCPKCAFIRNGRGRRKLVAGSQLSLF